MKYFKNEFTGEVFGFEDDGSQDEFIADGLVEMNGQQVYNHLHPAQVIGRDEVARMRQVCYSDPITGSDRHYMEAVRERAAGNLDLAAQAEAQGAVRYEEIKKSLPWPGQLM